MTDFGHFTVLSGLNNSGKSNFLRALNAFFTGYTDPESEIDVDEDFYRSEKRYRKKKKIRISVTFTIPNNFRFRKELGQVQALINNNEITITKEWERLDYYPKYYLNGNPTPLDPMLIDRAEQFLSMIPFRYIPNRVLPLDIIKEEHTALRDALVRRFGIKAVNNPDIFKTIKDSSSKLIEKMSKDFKKGFPMVDDVRLKTPDSWAEMLFALGYRILENKVEFDDNLQGSGIQSLLMFNTLSLIDRDYFQQFGWRQAAIWAVEEPESSLHANLEAHVASYLSEIANEPKSRLQIFATTHSDLMVQYGDPVVNVEKKDDSSLFEIYHDKKTILQKLASSGVSRWVDPILYYPLDPIVLVEGKFDYNFINQALKIFRPDLHIRTVFLEQLEGHDISGGLDELLKYVNAHNTAIKTRQKFAPLIIILDWDARNKKGQFEKKFLPTDPYKVLVWDESNSNPKLDKSVRGIERFFSDRIIQEAEQLGAPIAWTRKGIGKIAPHDRDEFKTKCNEIVQRGINPNDLLFCQEFLNEIINIIINN